MKGKENRRPASRKSRVQSSTSVTVRKSIREMGWKWIPAASCKSLVEDNGSERGITLLKCNHLQKIPLLLFLFPHCSISLSFCEVNHTWLQSVPSEQFSTHMLTYWAPEWACWYRPRAARGPVFKKDCRPPPLCKYWELDYSLLVGRLKPHPRCHTTAPPLDRLLQPDTVCTSGP